MSLSSPSKTNAYSIRPLAALPSQPSAIKATRQLERSPASPGAVARLPAAKLAGKLLLAAAALASAMARPAMAEDQMREMQSQAIANDRAPWGHWGLDSNKYSGWKTHSNRLIPIYTFGVSLTDVAGKNSPYRSEAQLEKLYGRVPEGSLNPAAEYFDQTDVYRLQKAAVAAGKKYIVLMVFDGTDWQTTWAAAVYRTGKVAYTEGRGTGHYFQDYRGVDSDFGFHVTSPFSHGPIGDPDRQRVNTPSEGILPGGYDWRLAGPNPWTPGQDPAYLISKSERRKQAFTDSAASATSMTCGIKTYNDAINVDPQGKPVEPIARDLQRQGFAIGVVTSVPVSHATPAAAYANNVSRDDFQDLTRDLLGLPSIAHPDDPLPGVDVLIGTGWGDDFTADAKQGKNFVPGNKYLTVEDRRQVDWRNGGRYEVVERTAGVRGDKGLAAAAKAAKANGRRLLGFFGTPGPAGSANSHLPFRTADGGYNPAPGVAKKPDPSIDPRNGKYFESHLVENPTLADMTSAALEVLAEDPNGFWLMIEAGDVDWANHDDNLDNSIGAVISGDDAFHAVAHWAEDRHCWEETAVIVTADHGHLFVLDDPEAIAAAGRRD